MKGVQALGKKKEKKTAILIFTKKKEELFLDPGRNGEKGCRKGEVWIWNNVV